MARHHWKKHERQMLLHHILHAPYHEDFRKLTLPIKFNKILKRLGGPGTKPIDGAEVHREVQRIRRNRPAFANMWDRSCARRPTRTLMRSYARALNFSGNKNEETEEPGPWDVGRPSAEPLSSGSSSSGEDEPAIASSRGAAKSTRRTRSYARALNFSGNKKEKTEGPGSWDVGRPSAEPLSSGSSSSGEDEPAIASSRGAAKSTRRTRSRGVGGGVGMENSDDDEPSGVMPSIEDVWPAGDDDEPLFVSEESDAGPTGTDPGAMTSAAAVHHDDDYEGWPSGEDATATATTHSEGHANGNDDVVSKDDALSAADGGGAVGERGEKRKVQRELSPGEWSGEE
ncbi:MAG: hypothetical protein M1826_002786 [Phylliscum demangeonii]|nr:MAG: hypothetical protein M1826_002786 [Phylliscum demangeonii]